MASDDAISSFAQDGVAIIRSIVRPDQLSALSEDIAKVRVEGITGEDSFCNWPSLDSFRDVALASSVPEHAADFLDSFQIRLHYDRIVGGSNDQRQRWVQDQPFAAVDSRSITAWVVVDNIAKGDSSEFWAGSHLGSWYVHEGAIDVDQMPEGQTVLPMPDLVADESSYDIRRWSLEPGDVLYTSSLTVHSIPESFAQHRAVALNYVDAKAILVDRPWSTVPDHSELLKSTEPGSPLDDERFPIAWPQG